MKTQIKQFVAFALGMILLSPALAAEIHLRGGEAVSIQPNSLSTVVCDGGGATESSPVLSVVAKSCSCVNINGRDTIVLHLIYVDGSKKDVDVPAQSSLHCAEEAQQLCSQN